jgi:hypothetical protein
LFQDSDSEVSNQENIQTKQVKKFHDETDDDDNFVFEGQKVQSKFLKQVSNYYHFLLILFAV